MEHVPTWAALTWPERGGDVHSWCPQVCKSEQHGVTSLKTLMLGDNIMSLTQGCVRAFVTLACSGYNLNTIAMFWAMLHAWLYL
jgi:hypothetical protein